MSQPFVPCTVVAALSVGLLACRPPAAASSSGERAGASPAPAPAAAATPRSAAAFAGLWILRIASAQAPGASLEAHLRLEHRGAVPERTLIQVGRSFYTRGEVFTGTVAGLAAAPGLPGALSGSVLAVAIRGDSLALAVLGPAPDAPADSVTFSGIALFGKWDGDSIVGDWQAASDWSGTRGAFVLRRP